MTRTKPKTAGQLLAAWREESDPPLSQLAASKLLGVGQSTYSYWERDEQVPATQARRNNVMRIAGIPLDAWVAK